jgi:hypothetical protein
MVDRARRTIRSSVPCNSSIDCLSPLDMQVKIAVLPLECQVK